MVLGTLDGTDRMV